MIVHLLGAWGFRVLACAMVLGALSVSAASVAVAQPGQLALVVPPDQVPPALQQAIADHRASLSAGDFYAGDCATVELPEDLIKWCSEVISIEGDTALVDMQRVVGEGSYPPIYDVYKQAGETWVYSGYVVVSAPAPPGTGTGDGAGGTAAWPWIAAGTALMALAAVEVLVIYRRRTAG